MRVRTAVAAALLACAVARAAPLPAHQIFLAPFKDGPGKTTRLGFIAMQRRGFTVDKPVAIIPNDGGDDDEPCFLPDSGGLLFTSTRDGKQRDVYRYDISGKRVAQVTKTDEDEHWPAMMPGGRAFSAARGTDLRLWRFNLDGSDAGPTAIHAGPIRNHLWVSPAKLAQVVPGLGDSPAALIIVDLDTGTSETVASNVGPELHRRPGSDAITFVSSPRSEKSQVEQIDPSTRKVDAYAPALDDADAMTWTPAGGLLMAAGSKVFVRENSTDRWIETADLSKAGLTSITKITVSPDGKWIAIVGRKP